LKNEFFKKRHQSIKKINFKPKVKFVDSLLVVTEKFVAPTKIVDSSVGAWIDAVDSLLLVMTEEFVVVVTEKFVVVVRTEIIDWLVVVIVGDGIIVEGLVDGTAMIYLLSKFLIMNHRF